MRGISLPGDVTRYDLVYVANLSAVFNVNDVLENKLLSSAGLTWLLGQLTGFFAVGIKGCKQILFRSIFSFSDINKVFHQWHNAEFYAYFDGSTSGNINYFAEMNVYCSDICDLIKLWNFLVIQTYRPQLLATEVRARQPPLCSCGVVESTDHYLLRCPNFHNPRQHYLNNLPCPLLLQNLLFGSEYLSIDQNMFVFIKVQKYIEATKRFA